MARDVRPKYLPSALSAYIFAVIAALLIANSIVRFFREGKRFSLRDLFLIVAIVATALWVAVLVRNGMS
jgi:hypothetical protein